MTDDYEPDLVYTINRNSPKGEFGAGTDAFSIEDADRRCRAIIKVSAEGPDEDAVEAYMATIHDRFADVLADAGGGG